MGKVSCSAHVRATTKRLTVDKAIEAAEADLAALRDWRTQDANTPMTREVGYRLIQIGQFLAKQGRSAT